MPKLMGRIKEQTRKALGLDDLSLGAVSAMREWADKGLGFNCTFVDDDMKVVVGLAQRAVLAGLASDFKPDMQRRFLEHAEKFRHEHEESLGRPIISLAL